MTSYLFSHCRRLMSSQIGTQRNHDNKVKRVVPKVIKTRISTANRNSNVLKTIAGSEHRLSSRFIPSLSHQRLSSGIPSTSHTRNCATKFNFRSNRCYSGLSIHRTCSTSRNVLAPSSPELSSPRENPSLVPTPHKGRILSSSTPNNVMPQRFCQATSLVTYVRTNNTSTTPERAKSFTFPSCESVTESCKSSSRIPVPSLSGVKSSPEYHIPPSHFDTTHFWKIVREKIANIGCLSGKTTLSSSNFSQIHSEITATANVLDSFKACVRIDEEKITKSELFASVFTESKSYTGRPGF